MPRWSSRSRFECHDGRPCQTTSHDTLKDNLESKENNKWITLKRLWPNISTDYSSSLDIRRVQTPNRPKLITPVISLYTSFIFNNRWSLPKMFIIHNVIIYSKKKLIPKTVGQSERAILTVDWSDSKRFQSAETRLNAKITKTQTSIYWIIEPVWLCWNWFIAFSR